MAGLNKNEINDEFFKRFGDNESATDNKLIEAFTYIMLKNNKRMEQDLKLNCTISGEILKVNDDLTDQSMIEETLGRR